MALGKALKCAWRCREGGAAWAGGELAAGTPGKGRAWGGPARGCPGAWRAGAWRAGAWRAGPFSSAAAAGTERAPEGAPGGTPGGGAPGGAAPGGGRGAPGAALLDAEDKLSDRAIVADLWGYLWPREDGLATKARVLAAGSMMVGSKLVGVGVPFLFKWAVDSLTGADMSYLPEALLATTPAALMVAYGVARAGQVRRPAGPGAGQRPPPPVAPFWRLRAPFADPSRPGLSRASPGLPRSLPAPPVPSRRAR